jgi:hypothetical protein
MIVARVVHALAGSRTQALLQPACWKNKGLQHATSNRPRVLCTAKSSRKTDDSGTVTFHLFQKLTEVRMVSI